MIKTKQSKILIIIYFTLIFSCAKITATEFKLQFPLNCTYGQDCFVQNYVDMDDHETVANNPTSKHYFDYNCGFLSYDKHTGTDLRLKDFATMEAGVDVLAAADGVIYKVVDDNDTAFNAYDGQPIDANKACGNQVQIKHTIGSETYFTQYCHMSKESIPFTAVDPSKGQKGPTIKKGTKLGQIGMTGHTMFPHLHIGVVKKNKDGFTNIDPFSNIAQYLTSPPTGFVNSRALNNDNEYCAKKPNTDNTLWDTNDTNVKKMLDYDTYSTAVLNFHVTGNPEFINKPIDQKADLARRGGFREDYLDTSSKNIFLWADLIGIKKNDKLTMKVINNNNEEVFSHSSEAPGNKVQYFAFMGKRMLAAGEYTATLSLFRNNQSLIAPQEINFVINNGNNTNPNPGNS